MIDYVKTIGTIASVATAVGVGLAIRQLMLTQRLAVLQFEDQMSAQYRALIRDLPIGALLGETLSDANHAAALPAFYHYFDLSNEQAFLHEQGRVSESTWESWRDGIQQNISRPAFARAWSEVAGRAPESFDELRRVVSPLPTVERVSGFLSV